MRNLVNESYKLEAWLAPDVFRVLKPNGEKYVLRPGDNFCSCPAQGDCCHKAQWRAVLTATCREYEARRRSIVKHVDLNNRTADTYWTLLGRLERAAWELRAMESELVGMADFWIPDIFEGYVALDPQLEAAWIAQQPELRRAAA